MGNGSYWNGESWVSYQVDSPFDKAKVFVLDLPPVTETPKRTGDLYINDITRKVQYWDGSTWIDISAGLEVITIPDVTGLEDALDSKAPLESPTFTGTVGGISKTMIGLSNVDNTSDANKPVSTATQTALDGKSSTGHTHTLATGATDVTATAAELNYVHGVTSSIQDQLNGKQASGSYATATHTHTVGSLSDWPSAVSTTEVGYLDGVTSGIQTQLDGKQASGSYAAAVHTHTLSQITDYPTAKARMTKTSQSPTYSSNTWTRVTDFATTDYNSGFTVDLTNGAFTIPATGYYDISFRQRWQNYGSAYSRAGAIVNGTSAPATDASNVIDISVFEHDGWLIVPQVVKSVPLTSGDVVTFWIRSATGSIFNGTNTAIPGWTSVAITKVA